jgi:hypothetical protein
MLKNIFKAAKDVLKSPIGSAIIGSAIPGLSKIPGIDKLSGFGGVLDLLEDSRAARGLTAGGISALLGANPTSALASGLLAGSLGGGDLFGGDGTIQDKLSGFFKTPEAPDRTKFISDNIKIFQDQGLEITDALISQIGEDYDSKYKDMESSFEKSLPYLAGAGGLGLQLYAAKQAMDNRPQYDMQSNPYMAQGGGVQAFAQGNEVDFPRMTGDIKGPGDGQSDSIPAMLSNDEHVVTKQEVETIGKMYGGDVDTGHDVLYAMRGGIKDLGDQMGVSYK